MSGHGREVDTPDADQARTQSEDDAISILIVDDEPKSLTVLRSLLESPSYRIVSASSADEALLALISDQFALLIVDVRMPGMSGFELAQIIRERKKTAPVPIIFLTAYYGEDEHVLDAYGAGAADYLHKPVSPAILRSKVAVFAELHRKTRAAESSARALLAKVDERRRVDQQLRELNVTLENRAISRTAELQESRARLRRAADLARLTYLSLDYGRGRMEVADNFAGIMGFALPSRIEGPTAIEDGCRLLLERVAATDRARFAAAIEPSQSEAMRKVEYRVVGDDGKERWIESEWHLEIGPDSRPERAFIANLDITERRLSEEQRRLLMAEINHRSKNLLSVIQAMVMQSARGADPLTFAHQLSDRLQGLSASQDLLIKNDWGGIALLELVHAQLGPFQDQTGSRIFIDGPPVHLTSAGAQALGMALHELAANAAKYGSLSNDEGRVHISWEIEEGLEPSFSMQWIEEGGPAVESSTRKRFGRLVVGRIVEAALGGKVEWALREGGLFWQLRARAKDAFGHAITGTRWLRRFPARRLPMHLV